MTQEELKISISIGAETAQEAVEALQEEIKKLGGDVDKLGEKTQNAAAAQAAFAAAAAAGFATIAGAIKSGTQALNAYESAMKGLESVASGRGIGQDALTDALDGVTDSFFSATSAAAAYKNLLTRGYSLDQATNTIIRLKDAATFGRQANLSLEEAVVTATEGIRNENSVLVDNAGVTKNVAKMWEDYAKARGLVTTSLTQQQKIEAEYLGIMEETQLQAGDLAKAADTLAGSQAEQAAQVTKLSVAFGSALEPAVKAVTEASTDFLGTITQVIETAPEVTSGLTIAAAGFTGLMAVLKAAQAAQAAFNVAALANPYVLGAAAIAAGVGLIAAAVQNLSNAEQAAAAREAERVEAMEQNAQLVVSLAREYDALKAKAQLSATEQTRLLEIEAEIQRATDGTVSAIQSRANGYNTATESAYAYAKAQREVLASEKLNQALMQRETLESSGAAGWVRAYRESADEEIAELSDTLEQGTKEIKIKKEGLSGVLGGYDVKVVPLTGEDRAAIQSQMQEVYDAYDKEAQDTFGTLAGMIAQYLQYSLSDGMGGASDQMGKIIGDAYLQAFGSASLKDAMDKADFVGEEMTARLTDALKAIDVGALQEIYNEKIGAVLGDNGTLDPGAETEAFNALMAEISASADAMLAPFTAVAESLGMDAESLAALRDLMVESADDAARLGSGLAGAQSSADAMADAAAATNTGLSQTGTLVQKITDNLKDTREELDWKRELLEDRRELKKAVDAVNDGVEVSDEWGEAVKHAMAQYGAASTIDLSSTLGAEIEQLTTDTNMLQARMDDTMSTARTLLSQIAQGAYGEITLDDAAAIAVLDQLIATMQEHGLEFAGTGGKKKGGGGGGGKSSAEQKAEEQRRAQEEAYNLQIQLLEHQKAMDQLTLQEEIETLERIRRHYAQTAEQIRDIDERLYAARKALRAREEEQIKDYHSAVADALEARYEAQYEAEKKRLDESREAWRKWSEDTQAAIQAQIDALDEKAQAEDREAVAAEKQRAIDRISQAMQFETDEYNLRQLQKQLEQAQKAWADVQSQWAREDAKKTLQDQMQAVQDQADAQIDALDKEEETLEAWLDEVTDAQRLAQEARQQIMQQGQEDTVELLRSFAPEYLSAGEDLGAAMYEGFVSRFGDITAFFRSLTSALEAPVIRAGAEAAGGAAGTGQTAGAGRQATVTQNVTFTVPVETPTDTARKMQQVNEALAAMI